MTLIHTQLWDLLDEIFHDEESRKMMVNFQGEGFFEILKKRLWRTPLNEIYKPTYYYIKQHFCSYPDFIILGGQKCGTTTLWNHLQNHPQVYGEHDKELRYFDINYSLGLSFYKNQFSTLLQKYSFHLRHGMSLRNGEASPFYIFYPHAPTRIHEILPNIKFIVMLRNPVERAFSHYQHNVRYGREDRCFEDAIKLEERRINNDKQRVIREQNYYGIPFQRYSYLSRGHYAQQLQNWFSIFNRDQFLILRSEDYLSSTEEQYSIVCKFLNIKTNEVMDFPQKNVGGYSKMDKLIKMRLSEYFLPHNLILYNMLNWSNVWEN